MEKLDRLGWAAGIAFTAYGVSVGVRVSDLSILEPVRALLPPGWMPWVRWQLAGGRRIALVRETLSPSLSSFPGPTGLGSVVRSLRLVRRWALPTLRSLGPASLRRSWR